MSEQKKAMNPIIKFWSTFYAAMPKIYIPGTKFDISMMLFASFFMTAVRMFLHLYFTKIHGFDPADNRTLEIVASGAAGTHSMILLPGLMATLLDQPYKPSGTMANMPQYYKDTVTALLSFCTGYMLYDTIFLHRVQDDGSFGVHPDDVPYVAHHIICSLYMSHCRVLGAGHMSTMFLIWGGEFSNPLQNAHLITRYAIQMTDDDTFWHVVHPYVELAFASLYFVWRTFVGPSQVIHMAYDFLFTKEGRKNIPWYVSLLWIPLSSAILIGSIPWTIECFHMTMDGLEVKYDKDYDYGPRYHNEL